MKKKNKNNREFLHQDESDFEETRQSRRDPTKCDNIEDSKKSASGRNPENLSVWRESRSHRHNFRETYQDGPEMTGGGIAETSPFAQVLQVRKSKTTKVLKCPPVISSGKMPKSCWEDKPMLVMKIIKRIRFRHVKETPQDGSSSSSTEREIPAGSGLVSEANGIRGRHQSEDREANAANEMETTAREKVEDVLVKNNISEMERSNQELQEEEAEAAA